MTDATGVCTIDNGGTSGAIVTSAPARVNNRGTIAGSPAVRQGQPGYFYVDNRAGAVITGSNGVAVQGATSGQPQGNSAGLAGATVVNAGTINGDVRLTDGSGQTAFVAAGGTVNGSVMLGTTPTSPNGQIFLYRGSGTGVTGSISAGDGIDSYGRSLTASGTVTLGAPLPATFEANAVEASGRGTVVTLVPVAGLAAPVAGLSLYGEGSVINRVDVTTQSVAGANFPANVRIVGLAAIGGGGHIGRLNVAVVPIPFGGGTRSVGLGNGLASFTNEATITGDIRLTTAAFVNSGTIALRSDDAGSVITASAGEGFSFANSGVVTLADTGPRPSIPPSFGVPVPALTIKTAYGQTVPQAVSISNSSRIEGGLLGAFTASTLSFANSGTISGTDTANDVQPAVSLLTGFDLDGFSETVDAAQVGIGNAGTITGGLYGNFYTAALSFLNTGTISANPDYENIAVALNAQRFDIDGQPFAADVAGATIENRGTIEGEVQIDTEATTATVTNSGRIAVTSDDPFSSAALEIDNATTSSSTLAVANAAGGEIVARSAGGVGVAVLAEAGFEDDAAPPAQSATLGIVNAGTIRADGGGLELPAQFFGAPNGIRPVRIAAGIAAGTSATGATSISLTNAATGLISATGADSVAVVLVGGADGGGDGGAALGTVTLINDGRIVGGAGAVFTPRRPFYNELFEEAEPISAIVGGIRTAASVDLIRNNAGGSIVGAIDLVIGDDRLENYGTIRGDVSLGDGDDTFVQGASAMFIGRADGGAGLNRLVIDSTGGGAIDQAGLDRFSRFASLSVIGGGTLAISGALPFDTVGIDGGNLIVAAGQSLRTTGATAITGSALADSLTVGAGATIGGGVALGDGANLVRNDGTVAGTIVTGAGNDTLVNGGRIGGASLGAGNDRFVAAAGSGVAGTVSGDAGTDTLEVSFAGTSAAPTPVALGGYSAFEQLDVAAGVGSVAAGATLAFDRIQVLGGRLIGLAGSTIAAPTIAVGTGATFGSAGSVVGNIAVAGTLSPGASPGTMTVTGNVGLAAGSTTLLELTPTVSDRLNISGTLAIASGATLTLTGERPLAPGAALDLIVAAGGISGSFATVNQPATIFGFLRQASDRIQLFGQFAATGFNPQVTATVNYVNAVLTGGQSSAPLIAALPSLLATGNATNAAAFARLNPEAYASATQIGIQNGLTLAKAARAGAASGHGDERGAFTFVQGLGDWRPLDGSAGQGTSRARTHSYGLLGGVGYGSAATSLGAFVGYLDARQRIAGLDARTDADGIVAGLIGHVAVGGFELSALLAHDGGKAETRRAVPGSATAASRYTLHNRISDTSLGYAVPLGEDWALKPELGLTYIETRRGRATEAGGGAFSLDVARRRSHATFVDGALTLRGGLASDATVRPWLSAGVRHQLNGRATLATAGFLGTSAGFSVLGVDRQATLATAGAGLAIALAPGLDLFGAYRGEFGKDDTGTNLNGGLKLRF